MEQERRATEHLNEYVPPGETGNYKHGELTTADVFEQ